MCNTLWQRVTQTFSSSTARHRQISQIPVAYFMGLRTQCVGGFIRQHSTDSDEPSCAFRQTRKKSFNGCWIMPHIHIPMTLLVIKILASARQGNCLSNRYNLVCLRQKTNMSQSLNCHG